MRQQLEARCEVLSLASSTTHWNCVRMKRASSSETALAPEAKKRKLMYATFSKWKVDMDKECQTVTWLDCDTEVQAGKRFVTKLRCSVCQNETQGLRYFSERWITGAESVRNSNI